MTKILDKNTEIINCVSSLDEAIKFRHKAIRDKKTFVVTNGCFDLLHSGHVFSLKQASTLGDYLWVLINSDSSVKKLKGDKRPIISELDRAYILSNLSCVSGVTLFNNERLDEEIIALEPDIYVKAGDYNANSIDKHELNALLKVKSQIKFVSFLPERNTSSLIRDIIYKHS
ncbi:MAG: adenylyltransferase/cytidyltransferase family protein [Opitutae bacterium]|nr:adenylyltransferase/cytidyltransferase family protein [Opitutae bacterium]MBT5716731.1 adenylyltransferase/cytidyltransferase family protein [Opitutae bacterium]